MELQRVNGYIDLNQYFLNQYGINVHSLSDLEKVIALETNGARNKFWFSLNNDNTMYKEQYSDTLEAYAEVFISELIKQMNIPGVEAADYDLATLNHDGVQTYGVVTKDFKKTNSRYIVGSKIIVEVYNKYIKNNPELIESFGVQNLTEFEICMKLNNLEDIWSIFDLYFKDNPEKDKIVAQLMDQMVNLYMFDALTIQGDRHPDNWSIEIDNDNNVRLAPIYDGSNALNLSRQKAVNQLISNFQAYPKMNQIKKPRLYKKMVEQIYHPKALLTTLPRQNAGKINHLESLQNFLKVSDSSYSERMIGMIKFMENGGLDKVIDEMERKTLHEIPENVKYYLKKIFIIHINELKNVLGIENERRQTL